MATRSRKTGHIFPHKPWTAEEFDTVFEWLKVPENRRVWNQTRVGGAELLSKYVSERVKDSYRGVRQIEHKVRDLYKRYNEVRKWKDEAKSTGVNESDVKTPAGGTRRPFQWYDHCDEVFGDGIEPVISMTTSDASLMVEGIYKRRLTAEASFSSPPDDMDKDELTSTFVANKRKSDPTSLEKIKRNKNVVGDDEPRYGHKKSSKSQVIEKGSFKISEAKSEGEKYTSDNQKNNMSLGNLLTKNDQPPSSNQFIPYYFPPNQHNEPGSSTQFYKSQTQEPPTSALLAQNASPDDTDKKSTSIPFSSDLPLMAQHKLEFSIKKQSQGITQEKATKPSRKNAEKPLIFKHNELSKLALRTPKSNLPNTPQPKTKSASNIPSYNPVDPYSQRGYAHSHPPIAVKDNYVPYQMQQGGIVQPEEPRSRNSYPAYNQSYQRGTYPPQRGEIPTNAPQPLTTDFRGYPSKNQAETPSSMAQIQAQGGSPTPIKHFKGELQSPPPIMSELFGVYPYRSGSLHQPSLSNVQTVQRIAKSPTQDVDLGQQSAVIAERIVNIVSEYLYKYPPENTNLSKEALKARKEEFDKKQHAEQTRLDMELWLKQAELIEKQKEREENRLMREWEFEKISISNKQALQLEETRSKAKVEELKLELQIVEAKLKLESLKSKK